MTWLLICITCYGMSCSIKDYPPAKATLAECQAMIVRDVLGPVYSISWGCQHVMGDGDKRD